MKRARPLAHVLDGEEGWDASLPDQAPPSQPRASPLFLLPLCLLCSQHHFTGRTCFNADMLVQLCGLCAQADRQTAPLSRNSMSAWWFCQGQLKAHRCHALSSSATACLYRGFLCPPVVWKVPSMNHSFSTILQGTAATVTTLRCHPIRGPASALQMMWPLSH